MWPVTKWKLSNTGLLENVILLHAANESSLLKVCSPDEKKPTGIFAPHRCPGKFDPNRYFIPMVTLSFVSKNNTRYRGCFLTYILRVYERVHSKCAENDCWLWVQDLNWCRRVASGWRINQRRARPLLHLVPQYGAFTEVLPAKVRLALSLR